MKVADLESALQPFGLYLRGLFALDEDDIDSLKLPISQLSDKDNLTIALVGNVGSSFWPQFTASPEYVDEHRHPLDRWSKRVALLIAGELDISPMFPSDGPPYFPFQQWAKRAEGLSQSPMGLLIHPQYGLWHAYRFALIFSSNKTLPKLAISTDSPCVSCTDQPCLNTCPVGAFTTNGYDVPKCAEYLESNIDSNCNQQGCQARLSCPAGGEYRYVDAQHLFHLKAFVDAR